MVMAYATVQDVQARMTKTMSASEQAICTNLLDDAAVMIDSYNSSASNDAKKVVSIRMVLRSMSVDDSIPIGATQGSMSGLGYSESWTVGSGSVGELYFGKEDKRLLGISNKIGASSPLEALIEEGACV
jgi:hypothetical protein